MNSEHFPYVYEQGHWLKIDDQDEAWSPGKIAETVVGGLVMAGTLVLVMMAWLCM